MPETIRLRLGITYDGGAFSGWAAQPGLRTVQGTLEDAVRILIRDLPEGPLLTVAGRTDAGVHASGQVAHLDLPLDRWRAVGRRAVVAARTAGDDLDGAHGSELDEIICAQFLRRMAGVLGVDSDVAVTSCVPAPEGFDARFSAIWRRYEYRLADRSVALNPLERHRVARITQDVDLDLMNAAAERLIGLHDFAGFCKPRPHATTIRTLHEFHWVRDAESGVLIARLVADAFCHSMVRSLVGMCAAVGSGRLALSDVDALLEADERGTGFAVLAPRGLNLMEVGYPGDDHLASRQLATRAKRAPLQSDPTASLSAAELQARDAARAEHPATRHSSENTGEGRAESSGGESGTAGAGAGSGPAGVEHIVAATDVPSGEGETLAPVTPLRPLGPGAS